MWALVFVCEALCHESSVLLFNSGYEAYDRLKERAAAQIQWAQGRFRYINGSNGIRQSAVFADYFGDRWAAIMGTKEHDLEVSTQATPDDHFQEPKSYEWINGSTTIAVNMVDVLERTLPVSSLNTFSPTF